MKKLNYEVQLKTCLKLYTSIGTLYCGTFIVWGSNAGHVHNLWRIWTEGTAGKTTIYSNILQFGH